MGLLDRFKGNRAGNLKEEYMAPVGYEARAKEERSRQRKEKLKGLGASTVQSIKKGAETTKTGIEKTRAWAQEQEKKKQGRRPSRGSSKRTTSKRAPQNKSISEEMGLGDDVFGSGNPFGGGDKRKKGGGPLIPF